MTEQERFIYSQMSPERQEQLLLDEFRRLDNDNKAWIYHFIQLEPFHKSNKTAVQTERPESHLRIVK